MNLSSLSLRVTVLSGLLCLCALAAAADQKVETLLSSMRSAYNGVDSATFTTESVIYEEDGSQQFTSTFAYKKPNLIRVIIKGTAIPAGMFLTKVSDGKTITTTGAASAEEPYTLDNFEKGTPVNLESMCFFDANRQLSTSAGNNMEHSEFKLIPDEEWSGKHWKVLEETAAKDKVFVRYFIDPNTNFIWRTLVQDLDTKKPQMDSHLTKLDTDAKLSEADFKSG